MVLRKQPPGKLLASAHADLSVRDSIHGSLIGFLQTLITTTCQHTARQSRAAIGSLECNTCCGVCCAVCCLLLHSSMSIGL